MPETGDDNNTVISNTIGSTPQFNTSKPEDFEIFNERLEFYFLANNITDVSKKKAILFANCGDAVYRQVRKLCSPKSAFDITYEEAIKLLKNHYCPKQSVHLRIFEFQHRRQKQGEPFKDFYADLRRMAEPCEFKDSNQAILSQILFGLNNVELTGNLMQNPDNLTLEKVERKILAYEAAKSNVAVFSNPSKASDSVHRTAVQYREKLKSANGASSKKPDRQNPASTSQSDPCKRCDGAHPVNSCRIPGTVECHYCHKVGHVSKACRKRKADISRPRPTGQHGGFQQTSYANFKRSSNTGTGSQSRNFTGNHLVQADETEGNQGQNQNHVLFHTKCSIAPPPYKLEVMIDKVIIPMEIDSGAGRTIIGLSTYKEHFSHIQLRKPTVNLSTWSKEELPILGSIVVDVKLHDCKASLPLVVMNQDGPTLMGRDWFSHLNVSVSAIKRLEISSTAELPHQIDEFQDVFSPELGKYTGPPASIVLKPGAKPVFRQARDVPFSRLPMVDATIDRLESDGVFVPMLFSKWASSTVNIVKGDGSIRICGDYSNTVNLACETEVYPLPSINKMLVKLTGSKHFTKLDLTNAFLQISVDQESSELLTVNTHRGLFRVTRLPFGLSSSPAIFQRIMDGLVAGIPGVVVFIDDLLITAPTEEEMWERVRLVLARLQAVELRLRRDKCQFDVSSLDFLGYHVSSEGVRPSKKKIEALLNAPVPQNKNELMVFLGFVNYYDRFFQDKATKFRPLYNLLQEKIPWQWTENEQACMDYVKEVMGSGIILAHYDPKLPIVLACDASPSGVGCVLSQIQPNGVEVPVACASRTLHPNEVKFAQIDREALAIIFGVLKFHMYLAGNEFTIITDNKPLLGIFRPDKQIPQVLSPRMLRWSLMLNQYNYKLQYKPGPKHSNADFFSRFAVQDSVSVPLFPEPAGILFLEQGTQHTSLNATVIADETKKDHFLSQVYSYIQHGRDRHLLPDEAKKYLGPEGTLSTLRGCVLRGDRVVIPTSMRNQILNQLHRVHLGIVRTKAVARSYVWWPNIDADIENFVSSCNECSIFRSQPSRAPVIPWSQTNKPWSRLHADFAGPFHGHTFLIVVDSHSKWVEVLDTDGSMSSSTVIHSFRTSFSTHGIPDEVVTDNGPCFRSDEFASFLKENQINHIRSAPYQPASNGQAERTVQTIKNLLKKVKEDEWKVELPRILLTLRTTPNASGYSPSELLMGRKIATLLDRLHPANVQSSREAQAVRSSLDISATRIFNENDAVLYRVYNISGQKWASGVILSVEGPRNFIVLTSEGTMERRHLDQLRRRVSPPAVPSTPTPFPESANPIPYDKQELTNAHVSVPEVLSESSQVPIADIPSGKTAVAVSPHHGFRKVPAVREVPSTAPEVVRRSSRQVTKPPYLSDFVTK